jgi:phytoene desaturase
MNAGRPLEGRDVVIIGGGIGGLSAAAYLAAAGADVEVIEKNEQVGGRASTLEEEGFRFDIGPSWYLMPDVFERFFSHFDHEPSDFYELRRLDPSYRIFFKDGDVIDIAADRDEVRERFESYEDGAGERFDAYLAQSRENYEVAMEHFVYTDRSRLRDFIDLDVLRHARGLSLIGNMQDHVEQYFDHPKLQQVMQYSLVFLGGAPTNTPALYNLMSHVDFNMGVYYPDGGIYTVIEAIEDVAEENGATVTTDEAVTAIGECEDGLVVKTDVRCVEPDIVVSNADYAYTELELLEPGHRDHDRSYWKDRTLAPSAFLLYLGVDAELDELRHHTLVLPEDWSHHFEAIFDDPELPVNPAYYVAAPSKTDDEIAPEGAEALMVLVPIAPGLDLGDDAVETFRDQIIADIEENTGESIEEDIVFEERFLPEDFASRYNSYRGTALGLAHTLFQTAFMRPSHRSGSLEGLYYTGAYTNPGIGMPMCLISGEKVAEKIVEDY